MEIMTSPGWSYEKKAWKRGFKLVAGIDEVGRGSFAGPVVAGAVIFAGPAGSSSLINDSKKLSANQREVADVWIKGNAVAFGIGQASVSQINKLGIKKASEIAFRRAIANCESKIDFLLIDAFYIPYVKGLRRRNQLAIIKGDTKSVSIAAASIIAKVYRDSLMIQLSHQPKYKNYGWNKNKGYGTKDHREAIKKHGVTSKHRKLFVRNCVSSPIQ